MHINYACIQNFKNILTSKGNSSQVLHFDTSVFWDEKLKAENVSMSTLSKCLAIVGRAW